VSSPSARRCRNGHPILATSAYCVTCGAPITQPTPAHAKTHLYTLAAPTRDDLAPPLPGHALWTILNPWTILTAVVMIAVGVALLAVVVASQL